MINISPLCLALLTGISFQLTALVHAEPPVTTPSIRQRGLVSHANVSRLAAVMAKARRGEEIRVVVFDRALSAKELGRLAETQSAP
jgi:hypothetical protein